MQVQARQTPDRHKGAEKGQVWQALRREERYRSLLERGARQNRG